MSTNHFEYLKKNPSSATNSFNSYEQQAAKLKREQDAQALANYNESLKSNNDTANKAYQNADILNQKLSKYIPNYVASQGINGGLAQSYQNKANLDVQNMYAQVSSDMQTLNQQAKENYDSKIENNMDAYNQALSTGRAQSLNDYNTALQDILNNENLADGQKKEQINNLWDSYADVLGEYKGQAETETMRYYKELADEQPEPSLNISSSGDINTIKFNDDISVKYDTTKGYDLKGYSTPDDLVALVSTGYNDKNQQAYAKNLAKDILNNKLKNGDLIEWNYGAKSSGDKSVWVYIDGKLYETTRDGKSKASIEFVYLPEGFEYQSGMVRLKSDYKYDNEMNVELKK